MNLGIIDDHPLICNSLKSIFEQENLFDSIFIYSSKIDIQNHIQDKVFHDVYIIDINLDGLEGREVIKVLKKQDDRVKIIALSSHDNPKIIQSTFRKGANTYLLKSFSAEVIFNSVKRVVIENEGYIHPEIQSVLTNYLRGIKKQNSNFPQLTKRELEILQLISEEMTSKEIADCLHLSEYTIEGHRASLFLKFDVKNLAGLIRKAIMAGAID